MQISAKLRHLHIAPRKVRLIADLIRGKSAGEAAAILNFITKKASLPISKLLNSAISNAKNNFQLDQTNLYISKITVDEGPKIKRFMPRARGSAYEIQKKTSHINLVLDEVKKSEKIRKVETEKPKELPVKTYQAEKSKFKPEQAARVEKPKSERGIKRIFRRKVF